METDLQGIESGRSDRNAYVNSAFSLLFGRNANSFNSAMSDAIVTEIENELAVVQDPLPIVAVLDENATMK